VSAREDDIIREVRRLIRNGRVQYDGHAIYQMRDRHIGYPEVEYVLEVSGEHCSGRDRWDDYRESTAYAIEGITLRDRALRIVVCMIPDPPIPEDLLLVITAIDITQRGTA
jgi:hypothetical protein